MSDKYFTIYTKKLFFLLFGLIFAGCTTTKYIPVESVRVDSVHVAKVQRDSVYVRDSVFVAVKADTVFKTSLKYVYRDRIVRDTISALNTDTITRVVEIERKMSRWEVVKNDIVYFASFY